jgi:hypothetical protein
LGFVNAQGFDLLKLFFIFCGYVDVGGRGGERGGAKSHKFFSFIGGFIDVWKQQPISHFYFYDYMLCQCLKLFIFYGYVDMGKKQQRCVGC